MLTSLFLRMTYMGAEWILWILLLLSVVSIALMIERWLYYSRNNVDGTLLSEQLSEELRNRQLQTAFNLVKDSESYECGVVAAGLATIRNGADACAESMQSAKARLRPALDNHLSILATIGSNSPFVGLLGTVLGIIKAAHELNMAGAQNNPSATMSGVFEALVATAVGLCVAIPAVVAYNLFQRRMKRSLAQADSLAHLLLAFVRTESRPSATSPTPAATAVPRSAV